MGYDDITESLHGRYCSFLAGPAKRKQATMPRSYVKTWIGSIAYPTWVTLPREQEDEFPYAKAWEDKFWTLGPNMRVLIASYVIGNAEKMIGLVRKTYESNSAMQMLFPEVIPHNFNKTKWSNQAACLSRTEDATEQTFEAGGIGGSTTSKHYDLILEDDLIYANKDDFTGKELQPNQEDIDKAIGWHKMVTSLLVPGKHPRIHNTGTRWARKDLVDFIWTNEPYYEKFVAGCVDLVELEEKQDWTKCKPTWNECYDIEQLKMIRAAQGHYMFSTQYLLQPSSPEERLFKPSYVVYYDKLEEIPKNARIFTTVDLSLWGTANRKNHDCNGVVLTCAWDEHNHMWIMHYNLGRFNPTQVLHLMGEHWTRFSPEIVGVESVYYQEALSHFAHVYMDDCKIPRMKIDQLVPKGNISKELRIRGLEPYASTLAIHCRKEHVEWVDELVNYVPNSKSCMKDILDAAAYQVQIARAGEPLVIEQKRQVKDFVYTTNMDEVLEGMMKPAGNLDRFGRKALVLDPYTDKATDFDVDPFTWL